MADVVRSSIEGAKTYPATVGEWERGRSVPSISIASVVRRYLGVSWDEITTERGGAA